MKKEIAEHLNRAGEFVSAAEQDREFEKCEFLRKRYLDWIAAGEVI